MDTNTELKDVSTGKGYRRTGDGDAIMSVQVVEHPYRQLDGLAFVALRDAPVFINDKRWEPVFGTNFVLLGGVEIDVDEREMEKALEDIESCDHDWIEASTLRPDLFVANSELDILVPAIINDMDLPPVKVLVPFSDLRARYQRFAHGGGAYAMGSALARNQSTCAHPAAEIGKHKCRACLRRFWTMKARELGVTDGG